MGKRIQRLMAGLLALAMIALTGCGIMERADSTVNQQVSLPSLASEHTATFNTLQNAWERNADDSGTTLRIYYDDTHSMMGFAKGNNGNNRFVYLLDAAIDEAYSMVNAPQNGIKKVEAYTLVDDIPGDGINQELSWHQIDVAGTLHGFFMQDSFYTGNHTGHREGTLNHTFDDGTHGQLGPLSRLFQDGSTPFVSDGLTVLISDLQEQGFDLDTLSNGLLTYCAEVPSAEVCIISATSAFSGQLSVPVYSISGMGTDVASVDNYVGDAPFYYVIVGPANLVDHYCAGIQEAMGTDSGNILFTTFCTNTAMCGQPLKFEAMKNTMVNVTASDLAVDSGEYDAIDGNVDSSELSASGASSSSSRSQRSLLPISHNTGTMKNTPTTKNASGKRSSASSIVSENIDKVWGSANINDLLAADGAVNVFTASTGRGTGQCSAFGQYSLISAYAELPDSSLSAAYSENGVSPADNTYWIDSSQIKLYKYTDGELTPADLNALGCIDVRFETVNGPLYEYATDEFLLAQNRHVAYLRVMINSTTVSDGGLFEDDATYYLSMPIHTSLNSSLVRNAEKLEKMSAYIAQYRAALEDLTVVGGNYNWSASSDKAREAAAEALSKTPKLDEFVKSLANYFQSSDTSSEVQYVDVMFTTSNTVDRR